MCVCVCIHVDIYCERQTVALVQVNKRSLVSWVHWLQDPKTPPSLRASRAEWRRDGPCFLVSAVCLSASALTDKTRPLMPFKPFRTLGACFCP